MPYALERIVAAAATLLLLGCSPAEDVVPAAAGGADIQVSTPAPGTETREGARPSATRVLGAAGSDCRLTGAWQICSVEDRLVRAGLAPQRADSAPAARGGSAVTARYWVGEVELQIYLFEAITQRDSAGNGLGEAPLLESAEGAPRSVVLSGNMAAVLFGHRPRQVERVELALSGGLPDG